LFAEGSYGYRPNRSAKDAIQKVKEYAEQGYTFAVVLDLSKYLEEKLKLTVNREKSRTVSVFAIRNFKFLGFALGRNGSGVSSGFIQSH
jgi:hypothetical protein